jgi:hypothetical protein
VRRRTEILFLKADKRFIDERYCAIDALLPIEELPIGPRCQAIQFDSNQEGN